MVTEIGTFTMLYMQYEVTIVDFGLACHTPAGSSAPPPCSRASAWGLGQLQVLLALSRRQQSGGMRHLLPVPGWRCRQ